MNQKEICAERIKGLRKERGWTQKVLSEKSGISVEAIKLYETARRIPDKYNRLALCNALRVNEEYIIGESDYKNFADKWDSEHTNERMEILQGVKFLEYCQFIGCDTLNMEESIVNDFVQKSNEAIKKIYKELKENKK